MVTHHRPTEHRSSARPVSHEYAALAFYTGGSATFEQRSRWSLQAGDAVLIPAGEAHRHLASRHPELWGLALCAPCLAADGDASLLEPFERVRSGESAVVRIPTERHAFLESLFVELARETALSEGDAHSVQRSLVTLIVAEVRRAADWKPREDGPADGLVAQSLRFIERSCLGPLTLQDVARAVHRSPAHVTTALRKATGRTAVEWIVSGRLAEARRRLLHTDERVDIIAERVGYADATHFIRVFRRAHGSTPAAWRVTARR